MLFRVAGPEKRQVLDLFNVGEQRRRVALRLELDDLPRLLVLFGAVAAGPDEPGIVLEDETSQSQVTRRNNLPGLLVDGNNSDEYGEARVERVQHNSHQSRRNLLLLERPFF